MGWRLGGRRDGRREVLISWPIRREEFLTEVADRSALRPQTVTRSNAKPHFLNLCNLWLKVLLLFSPSPLEIVAKSPAGAEVAMGNLKNLRRDRPGIVVIEAVNQGGKGLDVRGQAGEKVNRLAIGHRKIAVRSEQIRIVI